VERGLYIAATGMLAAQIRQDVIANNLANASTPGFKGDIAVGEAFRDMLLTDTATRGRLGPLSTGAQVSEIAVNLRNGTMRHTGGDLDVAINGAGWLQVQTDGGVRYTRNGALTTNLQGQITTAQGDPVLGAGGQPIVVDGRRGQVAISPTGVVTVAGEEVGQLGIVALQEQSIEKLGDSYVTGTPDPGTPPGQVAQGYLENANVNSVEEMVDLIVNMRTYEAGQKVIRAIDETLDKAVNQVGRVQ
jgi:flagellar basal-body rod protein FlgF